MMPPGQIFIIPVRLEPCVVPERLSKWQWIDIFQRQALKKIVETLKQNLDLETINDRGPQIKAQLIVIRNRDTEALFHLEKAISLLGRSSRTGGLPDINLSRFDPKRQISRAHAL